MQFILEAVQTMSWEVIESMSLYGPCRKPGVWRVRYDTAWERKPSDVLCTGWSWLPGQWTYVRPACEGVPLGSSDLLLEHGPAVGSGSGFSPGSAPEGNIGPWSAPYPF